MSRFIQWWGIEQAAAGYKEKIISGLGGFIAIFAIYHISQYFLGNHAYVMVASMGAATVLLFAVPHGALSQPWPLIGGNVISALIGVGCSLWIADIYLAAASAVGFSILIMYVAKCIHPPGGATALIAVIGGADVSQLGLVYILTPVLLNTSIILLIGITFNYAFPWRRYPSAWAVQRQTTAGPKFSHAAITDALKKIDSFVDVSEEDLQQLFQYARDFDAKH